MNSPPNTIAKKIKNLVFGKKLGWGTVLRAPAGALALLTFLSEALGFDRINLLKLTQYIVYHWDALINTIFEYALRSLKLPFTLNKAQQHIITITTVLLVPSLLSGYRHIERIALRFSDKRYEKNSKIWSTVKSTETDETLYVCLLITVYSTLRNIDIFQYPMSAPGIVLAVLGSCTFIAYFNSRLFFLILSFMVLILTLNVLSFIPALDEALEHWLAEKSQSN